MLYMGSFVRRVSLEKIDLAVFLEKTPHLIQVHLLQDRDVLGLNRVLTLLFNFKGVGGPRVVEIVHQGSDEDIEPLFFREHFLQVGASIVRLEKHLNKGIGTSSREKAWAKL